MIGMPALAVRTNSASANPVSPGIRTSTIAQSRLFAVVKSLQERLDALDKGFDLEPYAAQKPSR